MSESIAPPVQTDAAVPEIEPISEPRNSVGWVILLILFGLLVYGGFVGSFQSNSEERSFREEHSLLKSYVNMSQLGKSMLPGSPEKGLGDGLDDRLEKLKEDFAEHKEAAAVYAVGKHELGKEIDPSAVQSLAAGKQERTRALARLYGKDKLTPEEAQAITASLPDSPFTFALAKVHANEKAGLTDTGRDALTSVTKTLLGLGMMLVLVLICLLGLVLWVVFFSLRSAGKLKPMGMPLGTISAADADRLALKGALIMLAFVGISQVIATLKPENASPLAGIIPPVTVVLLIFLVSKFGLFGKRLSLAKLGVNRDNLGKNIGFGFVAFAAELPISLGLLLLGQRLFRGLPPPSHPAADVLANNPGLVVILTVLFLASIMAPIWEEIMFRGILFPGTGRFIGIFGGALLSSFLFAAIHPQGIVAWLGLGTVAAVSCALVYFTRSLVPSIVMHALHNTTILLVALTNL